MKDLEVMVQNLINSSFETITTVQGGVELLDIFMHFSNREVKPYLLLTNTNANDKPTKQTTDITSVVCLAGSSSE